MVGPQFAVVAIVGKPVVRVNSDSVIVAYCY